MRQLSILSLMLALNSAYADPAAWRATHPELDGELILLGSVHALRRQDYPLPDIVDSLYRDSDALIMELDMDDLDPVDLQFGLLTKGKLDSGVTLDSVIGAELYQQTERQAIRLGVMLAALESFEPWLIAITLSTLDMASHGYHAEMGIEQHFVGRARADRKPILGLESLDQQVSVFDNMPVAEQRALLRKTLQELQSTEASMAEMIEAWREGQLGQLADRLADEFLEFPDLYQRLISQRNAAWADQLLELTSQPRRFLVVVGALHLLGENNVLELLALRGFEITDIQ